MVVLHASLPRCVAGRFCICSFRVGGCDGVFQPAPKSSRRLPTSSSPIVTSLVSVTAFLPTRSGKLIASSTNRETPTMTSKPELKTANLADEPTMPPNKIEGTIDAAVPDPYSPESLRLSQAFTDTVPVKKVLTTVPVRKPGQQDFVRVHPDPTFRDSFAMIELKDDREEYVVHAHLVPQLFGEVVNKQLFLA